MNFKISQPINLLSSTPPTFAGYPNTKELDVVDERFEAEMGKTRGLNRRPKRKRRDSMSLKVHSYICTGHMVKA